MHYNVLFLLLFPAIVFAQYYTPMYPVPFPYFSNTYVAPTEKTVEEDYEKDRGIYYSRYENEYTALPETHQPDYHELDIEPINPYADIEIIIMEYD